MRVTSLLREVAWEWVFFKILVGTASRMSAGNSVRAYLTEPKYLIVASSEATSKVFAEPCYIPDVPLKQNDKLNIVTRSQHQCNAHMAKQAAYTSNISSLRYNELMLKQNYHIIWQQLSKRTTAINESKSNHHVQSQLCMMVNCTNESSWSVMHKNIHMLTNVDNKYQTVYQQ